MTEPEQKTVVQQRARRLNPTVIALLGSLVILLLLVAYFAANRNPNQDKLSDDQLVRSEAPNNERRCASKTTYDLIKRDLFRRAAQLRGSDQAAFDRLSAYAVVRMENPVMESEDNAAGTVNCSGSLSIDLPPGVAVVGGRRTLTADIDYTVQPAADGSGDVVLLRNADAIIAPLATLARIAAPAQPIAPPDATVVGPDNAGSGVPPPAPAPTPEQPATRPAGARPSFDCDNARTRGEIAVCSDAGLAALDRNMAAQYSRSMAAASPAQRDLLRRTRDRFLAFRDRCPNRACIGDAYTGRMREIRDIMEGRWTPPR